MKRLFFLLLLPSLVFSWVYAQQLVPQGNQTNFRIPYSSKYFSSKQQSDPGEVPITAELRRVGAPMSMDLIRNVIKPKTGGDLLGVSARPDLARNLPMSDEGEFLSVDGYPVRFEIPRNPNDPGICKTPLPTVVLTNQDAEKMANCPFVVPCDNPTNRDATSIPASPNFVYMKLNWTVVRDAAGASTSNITQARIDDLMTEVNADFAPFGIQFCADPATFVNDGTLHNLNVGTEDATLKTTYGTTPVDWINIYVVNQITNPSAGGYARFPYDPFGGTNIRGGVVLARGNCFLGTHTLAHELGHTFGLHHTFHGVDEVTACTNCYEGNDNATGPGQSLGGDTEGDWCQDTPPHPTNSNICGDAGSDGCAPFNAWVNSPVNNHMSYSFCTSQFTTQQARRMHCMINSYLGSWTAYGGSTCGTQPPVANFVGNPTYSISPGNITFTDLSLPASTITNWQWDFDLTNVGLGTVTPATFVGQTPPTVLYPNAGLYTVRLIVTNANGSDTVVATNYIEIVDPPAGGQCDTLDQLFTPAPPGFTNYFYGPGDWFTGIPNAEGYVGFYERYFTTAPNFELGEIFFYAGNVTDNTGFPLEFNFGVYPDDGTGLPDIGNPLYESTAFGADTVFPGAGFFAPVALTFCPPLDLDTNTSFHVGIEITSGRIITGQTDADTMLIMTTPDGFGQNAGLNTQFCPGCLGPPFPPNPFNRYNASQWGAGFNIDFDLAYLPIMGPAENEPFLGTILDAVVCDTTAILYPVFAGCDTPSVWEFEFSTGLQFTETDYSQIDSFVVLHTEPSPITLEIRTDNYCGRKDTISYTINYPIDKVPNVDFTKNTGPHCVGDPVNFTGTPAGLPLYTFDFGDGSNTSGPLRNVSHVYTAPGLYYVTMTALSTLGNCTGIETKLDYVEVIDCSVNPPLAGFDQNPDTGCAPLNVAFTDTSLALPDPATSWYWAFDDGTFSIAQNPTHQFDSVGTYNVMLVASNAGGSDTAYFPITVTSLCILPFDITLYGAPVGEDAVLNWEIPEEAAMLSFELERSLDGANYERIASLHNPSKRSMSYLEQPGVFDRPVLYRLKMIDTDGSASYTNTVEISLGTNEDWLRVYPNPVAKGTGLNVDAFMNESSTLALSLTDVVGKQVLARVMEFPAGMNRIQLDTSILPSGTYFLKVVTGGTLKTVKVQID